MALNFDLAEAGRFLDFFGEGEPHAFQYFDDSKKGGSADHFYGHLPDLQKILCLRNEQRRGIYFMVNWGDGVGRSAENVTDVRALFVDLDGAPLEPVNNAPLEPHVIVESSPGKYQAYWFVDGCPLARFRGLQIALARRFGSDPSVQDLARVMRIPGFFHYKQEPFRVRTIKLEAGMPYPIDKLVAEMDLAPLETQARIEGEASLPDLEGLSPGSIQPGNRHKLLVGFAIRHAATGYSRAEVLTFVQGINHTYCSEPKPLKEVMELVDFAMREVAPFDDMTALAKKAEALLVQVKDPLLPAQPVDDVFAPERPEESQSIGGTSFALPVDMLVSAPGITGEIANWLTESNFYWQPSYSLAAALAFVGMLKGHQVRTEADARTNLLTIAVGPSSSGKTGPLKKIQALAREAGLSQRICGEPMSEQGLVKGLIESGHKAMIPWDEIGLAFKGMFSSNAPGYKSGIVRLILRLYSMADETLLGFQYANADSKNPRADLHQPCLCLYGTTTQEGIFGAFSSVEAVNGFAARLLIFETHDYLAERQPVKIAPPPKELAAKVREISGEDRPKTGGNLSGAFAVPNPVVVPYSRSARLALKDAGQKFESLKNKSIQGKRHAEESIWGRAYEQVTKVALTVEDGPEITETSMVWAVELITQLCRKMIVAAREQIADNQTHAEVNRLLRLIKDAHPKWVDANYLYQQTRAIPRIKRRDYLLQLQEEGVVVAKEETTSGRKRTLFSYVP